MDAGCRVDATVSSGDRRAVSFILRCDADILLCTPHIFALNYDLQCVFYFLVFHRGRFDKIIFLPPPDKEARRSILEKQLKNVAEVSDEIRWDILIDLTETMTGAEIIGACQEAKLRWMRETFLNDLSCETDTVFQQDYIVNALMSVKPLLSNPQALEEFQVFENRDKKSVFIN
jgi:SpoVK/Ycf46/Vps4 family AAA+-type ATPase